MTDFIVDPSEYSADSPDLFTQKDVQEIVPHRFEFALLDGVLHVDEEKQIAVGYVEAKEDSWWARGHVPGRPLMPGVLMVEHSAQLCIFLYKKFLAKDDNTFMGFGGMEDIRFRGEVTPPKRLITAIQCEKLRRRANYWKVQSFCEGKLIFSGRILAVSLR